MNGAIAAFNGRGFFTGNVLPSPSPANVSTPGVTPLEKPKALKLSSEVPEPTIKPLPDARQQVYSELLDGDEVISSVDDFAGQKLLPAKIDANWGKVFPYKHGGQMSAIEHIMYRHSYNSGFSNVSRYAQGTSVRMIKDYVEQAVRYGTPIKNGFEYNFGRTIGTNMNGGAATSIRVFIRDGWVRTAFPF